MELEIKTTKKHTHFHKRYCNECSEFVCPESFRACETKQMLGQAKLLCVPVSCGILYGLLLIVVIAAVVGQLCSTIVNAVNIIDFNSYFLFTVQFKWIIYGLPLKNTGSIYIYKQTRTQTANKNADVEGKNKSESKKIKNRKTIQCNWCTKTTRATATTHRGIINKRLSFHVNSSITNCGWESEERKKKREKIECIAVFVPRGSSFSIVKASHNHFFCSVFVCERPKERTGTMIPEWFIYIRICMQPTQIVKCFDIDRQI